MARPRSWPPASLPKGTYYLSGVAWGVQPDAGVTISEALQSGPIAPSPTRKLLYVPGGSGKVSGELRRFRKLDRELYCVARKILVLKHLDWPLSVQMDFLRDLKKGRSRLPKVSYSRPDFTDEKRELLRISGQCDREHPVGNFLRETAESYLRAMLMVEHAGTATLTELSKEIYGAPDRAIGWGGLTHLQAADQFIESTSGILNFYCVTEESYYLTPRYVASQLRKTFRRHFRDHKVKVKVDRKMASKARAGARTIRVRARTGFSELDLAQLTQHEGFVHTLTKINGQEQKNLKCLGLSAPRTMQTQEGLATFAELVTNTIDLQRLLRIALRTRAVQMALDGADFLQVFEFFRNSGQDAVESYNSARRVFRGGNPRGHIAFTKDVVYLQGLVLVHTFFRKAIQRNKFFLAQHVFSGRLTLSDAISLTPFFESGFIREPYYVPPWLRHRERLAAHLCYSVFSDRINLSEVRFGDFLE